MGKEIYIDILDYKNKNIRKKISNERYIKLLNNLNKNGIWILNDHYRKDSPNGYYEVEIKKGIAHNSFKIEAGVPFSGNNSKFLEIIRSITNIAELVIYD